MLLPNLLNTKDPGQPTFLSPPRLLDPAYAMGLGSGEAAVISYAAQHQHIALAGDRKVRKMAQRTQVRLLDSGSVLLALKRSGQIEKIAPALQAWRMHGYFVAPGVMNELLCRAGEMWD